MQQHKHFWHSRRLLSRQPLLLALLGAGALLALLVVAGWGRARAAMASAGSPTLSIVGSSGSTVTLEFDFWAFNQPLTLSYLQGTDCGDSTPLPTPDFEVSSAHFQHPYTLPGSIPQDAAYHLCASDPLDGTVASANTFFVTAGGTIQLTPPVPTSTPTSPSTSGSPTPPLTSTPGNQGTSANGASNANNSGGNTLVAIILLCLLVLALLAYLIRLWLVQGRHSSPGGGQTPP